MGRLFPRNRLLLDDPAHQNFQQIDCPRGSGWWVPESQMRCRIVTPDARIMRQAIPRNVAQEPRLYLFRIRSGVAKPPTATVTLEECNVCASSMCRPEFAETIRQFLPGVVQTCALSATGVPSSVHIAHPFVHFVQDRHKGRARPEWEARRVPWDPWPS